LKTKLVASPDRSGILLLASLARKRYSGWQERWVWKKPKISASKKNKHKTSEGGFDSTQPDTGYLQSRYLRTSAS